MDSSVKQALILAAGRGRRLMPYTKDRPKCLVEVGGKPILYYQLKALQDSGIKNLILVTGYKAAMIKNCTVKNFPDLKFGFVYNPKYLSTNDIYSLYLARRYLTKDVFILDSDVLFHPEIISKLIDFAVKNKSALATRRGRCGQEEMKIACSSDSRVLRLSKKINPKHATGEFMGISFFTHNFLKVLSRQLEEAIKYGGVRLDREVAIEKVFADDCHPLYAVDISRFPAIEIDFPEDLSLAERFILPKIKQYFSFV